MLNKYSKYIKRPNRSLKNSVNQRDYAKLDHRQQEETLVNIENHQRKDEKQMRESNFARDRPRKVTKLPQKYGFNDLASFAFMALKDVEAMDPRIFEEAMEEKDSRRQEKDMDEEMNFLKNNDTQVLVDKRLDQKLVGYKWIYKIKEGVSNGEKARYKANF